MPKKPTKAERLALVKAYAVQRAAKLQNAPIKDQQRLWKKFDDLLARMFEKYRDYLGPYPAPEFFHALEAAAVRFNATRNMSGAGVDW